MATDLTCTDCSATFPAGRGRHASRCEACRAEYRKAYDRERGSRRGGTPQERSDRVRRYRVKSQYGITVDTYDALLAAQAGGCAICGGGQSGSKWGGVARLAIDHDHSCCPGIKSCGNCIRGLLCGPCNSGIGQLGDDPARMAAAINYLTRERRI